ncbi:hypothetical protein C8T65DRAFT_831351 [Cerioporus squamosus]|nr:hypothetical protein C8T65DRAFT_831351 [Cerioporus squamosus]
MSNAREIGENAPFIEPVLKHDPRWAGCWCWGKGDTDHLTYRVPEDTPRFHHLLRYMSLKQVAFFPYTRRINHRAFHIESAWCIARRPIEQLEIEAEQGDAESMLELALRIATSCEITGDALRCVALLETILGRRASKTAYNVTVDIRRRALSMLSQAHMDKHHLKSPEVRATAIGYFRDSDLVLAQGMRTPPLP